jgi:hypothetical protein
LASARLNMSKTIIHSVGVAAREDNDGSSSPQFSLFNVHLTDPDDKKCSPFLRVQSEKTPMAGELLK